MQHSCGHYNAFCSITWQTRMYLRTWQQNKTTIMQPFTVICNHRFQNSLYIRTHEQPHVAEHPGGTDYALKRSKPQPPHTRAALHRRLQPLYPKKRNVSRSGFLPKTNPMQHSCGHHNAFCSITWQTRMYLRTCQQNKTTIMQPFTVICNHRFQNSLYIRTHEQPHVAEHPGGTDYALKRSKPQPPHTRAALHRRLQPLYPKKRNVSRSGFLPKTNPMQHSCGHHNAFCSITWQTRMYLRTWQQNKTTIMQPFTVICNHRFQNSLYIRTHEQPHVAEHPGGTDYALKRSKPQPPHTRAALHHRLQPLYPRTRNASRSGCVIVV